MRMATKRVRQRRWTRADLALLPDDGNRYEVLDGQLLVTPQASLPHQWIAMRLILALEPYCARHGIGCALGPGAVPFGRNELQPDVLVVPGTSVELVARGARWEDHPRPLLVVEVLSRSTERRDVGVKREAYLSLRIPDYWVVDRFDRRALVWATGSAEPAVTFDVIRWRPLPSRPDVPPLVIALDEILPPGGPGPGAE